MRLIPVRLSVCPSVCPVRANSKTKKRRKKTKLAETFPTVRLSGMPIFSSNGQRSRSQDVQNLQIWRLLCLRAAAPVDQARQAPTTHYRSTPLLGLLYCRRWDRGQRDGRPHIISVRRSLVEECKSLLPPGFIFHQDGAPAHTAKLSQDSFAVMSV